MKNLTKGDLKKDVYEEEIIRVDYLPSNDFRKNVKELIRLFYEMRLYMV